MLKPQQIPELKQTDRALYALARIMCDSINKFALQLGIDPKPASQINNLDDALPAPRAPKTITVTTIAGAVLILLESHPDTLPTAFYFVERSSTKTFDAVTRYTLGHGLHLAIPSPAGDSYWRAFCKYQMSDQSPYVVAGALGSAGGGFGTATTTETVATINELRKRPPSGVAALSDDSDGGGDSAAPGKPGKPGVGTTGPRGRTITVPALVEEPETPIVIPGRRGTVGPAGAVSKVPGKPAPEPEPPEDPIIIMGRRGTTGATGAQGRLGRPAQEPQEPEDPLVIPGRRGPVGAASRVPGRPAQEPEEPEAPLIIPGRQGKIGAPGKLVHIPMMVDEPDEVIAIPGRRGLAGAASTIPGPEGPAFVLEEKINYPDELNLLIHLINQEEPVTKF